MLTPNRRRGFTLVEILIVVIILGVLAAIVVPLFAGTTTDAKRAALSQQLGTLRAQIYLFMVQHGDQRPTLSGSNWDDLMLPTVHNGVQIQACLPHKPRNVLNNFSNVAVVQNDPAFGDPVQGSEIGFVYNPNTGGIWGTNTAGNRIYNEAVPDDPNN